MKKYFLLVILSLTSSLLMAQLPSKVLQDCFDRFQKDEKTLQQLHEEGKYQEGETLLKSHLKQFEEISLPQEEQKQFKNLLEAVKASLCYNLACFQAQQNKKKEALASLEKAVQFGYEDYQNVKNDKDLANLRKEKKFKILLEQLRPFDKITILQKSGAYRKESTETLPKFTYQRADELSLKQVREYFKLDSVAGTGDELSKIINLLHYVHNTIAHDGGNYALCEFDAIDIYNYHKATGKGVNCRHLAITLNEMYLALGIPSRYVTCSPKNLNDADCHVINSVYSQQLQKWIWIDPTNNAYVKDENGNFLSIAEVRDRLIHNKPLVLNADANWNNQQPQTKETYLENYMAKNLYWFSCPLESKFNPESRFRDTATAYMVLLPTDFVEHYKESKEAKKRTVTITCDVDYFWQKPL